MDDDREEERGMRFSPHRTISRTQCCVPGCRSYAKFDPDVRFHGFPNLGDSFVDIQVNDYEMKKMDRRLIWEKNVKLTNLSKSAKVCSLHFRKGDYIFPDYPSNARMLKKTAIPTLNLPQTQLEKSKSHALIKKKKRNLKRDERTFKQSMVKEINNPETYQQVMINEMKKSSNLNHVIKKEVNGTEDVLQVIIKEVNVPGNFEQVTTKMMNFEQVMENQKIMKRPTKEDKELESIIQNKKVKTQKYKIESNEVENVNKIHKNNKVKINFDLYTNFIANEKDLDIMTGLSNFNILNMLEKIVSCHGIEYSTLSVKDRIVMALLKLRQGLNYQVLSRMFRIDSEEDCKKLFLKMLDNLSSTLKFTIHWPDKEELKNVTFCFNEFKDVRAIINFITINVQKPENSNSRIISKSNYNNTTIIKIMTTVSLGGLITYISKPYLGKTSENIIFEESNLIDSFNQGDELMTNGELMIDDICSQHKVKLVKPHFPSDKYKNKLSQENVNWNAKINEILEIMQKTSEQIEVFEILKTNIPSHLASRLKQILTIICAVVNLRNNDI